MLQILHDLEIRRLNVHNSQGLGYLGSPMRVSGIKNGDAA